MLLVAVSLLPAGHRQVTDGPVSFRCRPGRRRRGHHRLPGHADIPGRTASCWSTSRSSTTSPRVRPTSTASTGSSRCGRRGTHDYNRVWKIHDLTVRQDGAKAEHRHQVRRRRSVRSGSATPTCKVSGVHTYDFSYAVKGAFLVRNGRIELAWNAIGTSWPVPIETAKVSLDPAGVGGTSLSCVYGTVGVNKPCARSGTRYTAGNVQQYQGMTVGYAFPIGSIAATGPILEHRLTPSWVFLGRTWAVALGALIALGGLVLSFLRWWRHGRDESYEGQIPGLVPDRRPGGRCRGRPAAGGDVGAVHPARRCAPGRTRGPGDREGHERRRHRHPARPRTARRTDHPAGRGRSARRLAPGVRGEAPERDGEVGAAPLRGHRGERPATTTRCS